MNRLELLYAKLNFRLNTAKRMATCRKVGSLLRNNFTLMDALGRIERIESKSGTKPNEPFAIAMRQFQKNLERGMPFFEATRGWVPRVETMLLTTGDMSKLHIALENIERVITGTDRINRALLSAVAYPLFLLALTIGIVIMVGIYLVPPLMDAAGGDIVWRGTAASLIWISNFARNYWPVFVLTLVSALAVIWISLPIWHGRIRAWFDKIPPWNLYKIQASAGWMMAMGGMVAAGGTVPQVLRTLADNSTPYIRDILETTLHFIANGDNLGTALSNANRDFPDADIIGDLAIYADMNGFDQNIYKIASDYLDSSIRKMESVSGALNSFGILLVSAIIGWVVLGTFQMQDQITAALT